MMETMKLFAELLDERLRSGVPTTEDAVRYTFFHALLASSGYRHTDVVLELPHPAMEGAQIDLVVRARGELPSFAGEFKYDRTNPGGTTQNRTQRAGAVFNDLFRLARVPDSLTPAKYFIYLTDPEMASYFRNPSNELPRFFELPIGQSFPVTHGFVAARARTFREKIRGSITECTAVGALRRELAGGHCLRIYEVRP